MIINRKHLMEQYVLNEEELDMLLKKEKELINIYQNYAKAVNNTNNRFKKIKEGLIFDWLTRIYRKGNLHILDYLVLFINHDYKDKPPLDKILFDLYNITHKHDNHDYLYYRYSNLLIESMENKDLIINLVPDDKKELISRFTLACNNLYTNDNFKCFSTELIDVDMFLDNFFTYVIFNNKSQYMDKINKLIDEIEKDYSLFASKLSLNEILRNVPLYLEQYFNDNEKQYIYIK